MNVWLLTIDNASIDKKFDNFAKREGATERRTDTAAYWDAMDASKKKCVANTEERSTLLRVSPLSLKAPYASPSKSDDEVHVLVLFAETMIYDSWNNILIADCSSSPSSFAAAVPGFNASYSPALNSLDWFDIFDFVFQAAEILDIHVFR